MPNSNMRGGSIKACKKHASKSPIKKARRRQKATSPSGMTYDKKVHFEHKGIVYRKATDQHRADDGEGFCEVCVRGAHRAHHHTCTKASDYCDKKEQYELGLNKRLNYAGIEGQSLCNPISGTVLNFTELPFGKLKAIDGDVAAGITVGASPATLHRVQQQTERVSDWYTLDSPLKRCLGIAERPDKITEDVLYEELRVAGESDETKSLRVQKDREERNEYMKQQLQQQQQNWKDVFGSCAVLVHRKKNAVYRVKSS